MRGASWDLAPGYLHGRGEPEQLSKPVCWCVKGGGERVCVCGWKERAGYRDGSWQKTYRVNHLNLNIKFI